MTKIKRILLEFLGLFIMASVLASILFYSVLGMAGV